MKPGDRLDAWVIDGPLGGGAFGEVFLAHSAAEAEFEYAIKVLRPGQPEEVAQWFLREARIMRAIRSEHVCSVHHFGRTQDSRPYIVMDRLHGSTLKERLAEGPLARDVAIAYARQICAGLVDVHAGGYVHRDLKPSNIFVSTEQSEPRLRLIDFNIARAPATLTHTLTQHMPGTLSYMSPEQHDEEGVVDHQADIWALGVVLFEMITGDLPFKGKTPGGLALAISRMDYPKSNTTSWAEPILSRCLTSRENRFTSAAELLHALEVLDLTASSELPVAQARAEPSELPIAQARAEPAAPALPAVPPATEPRSLAARVRDAIADQGLKLAVALFVLGLALDVASFLLVPELNHLRDDHGKPTGYFDSPNWWMVHTILSPVALGLASYLLAETRRIARELGLQQRWNAHAVAWLVIFGTMVALVDIGYTCAEWRGVVLGTGCQDGYLGWPNALCSVDHGAASVTFMVAAASAQIIVLCTSSLMFSTVAVMCYSFLVGCDASARDRVARSVGRLFEIAAWVWALLYVSLFLARLWSFHLQTEGTQTLIDTVTGGSLFEIRPNSQPDWGSMLCGMLMLALSTIPFVVIRTWISHAGLEQRFATSQRAMLTFGVVATLAMFFPRLGFFILPGVIILGLVTPRWRSAIPWPFGQ